MAKKKDIVTEYKTATVSVDISFTDAEILRILSKSEEQENNPLCISAAQNSNNTKARIRELVSRKLNVTGPTVSASIQKLVNIGLIAENTDFGVTALACGKEVYSITDEGRQVLNNIREASPTQNKAPSWAAPKL